MFCINIGGVTLVTDVDHEWLCTDHAHLSWLCTGHAHLRWLCTLGEEGMGWLEDTLTAFESAVHGYETLLCIGVIYEARM